MNKETLVRWIDARSYQGWCDEKDVDVKAAEIVTLGYLVSETDDVLCIASSVDEEINAWSGVMIIPKVCILERRDVSIDKKVVCAD